MIIYCALSIIARFSLYFSASGILAALLMSTSNVFVPFLAITASCIIGYLLKDKHVILRLIPWALSLFGLLAVGSYVNVFWVAPAYLYSLIINCKKQYTGITNEFSASFRYVFWLSLVLGFAASLLSVSNGGDNGSLAFSAIFIVSSVLFMRYSRHNEQTIRSVDYNIWSAKVFGVTLASTACVSIACVLLSKSTVLISKFFLWLGNVIKGTPPQTITPAVPSPPTPPPSATLGEYVKPPETTPADLKNMTVVVIILLIDIAIGLVVFMVKKFNSDNKVTESENYTEQSVIGSKKRRKNAFATIGNRFEVRRCFKRLIRLCRKKGGIISVGSTSQDICNTARDVGLNVELCDKLRKLYIVARYDSEPITNETVKQAKALYNNIRLNREGD